eukprot:TRINITY_DN144_c0_g1_i1.p1 TRINITY_DN144_c0_g1~~TRINITY_DN144_c0_g1_i1.p1  ORF type:complete len:100 (+),score=19.95 TRINITY_DN144_c0_g1_i1:102-401(+)
MSELTACPGGDCPLKQDCLRYRAVRYGRYNSWGSIPYDQQKKSCEHFVSINKLKPTEESIRQRAYMIYLNNGKIEGRDKENYFQAEKELNEQWKSKLIW